MGGCNQPGVRNQDSRLHIGCLYGFHLASWPHGRSTAQWGTVEVSFTLSLVPEHHHWLLAAVPDERCRKYRWHQNTPAALLHHLECCLASIPFQLVRHLLEGTQVHPTLRRKVSHRRYCCTVLSSQAAESFFKYFEWGGRNIPSPPHAHPISNEELESQPFHSLQWLVIDRAWVATHHNDPVWLAAPVHRSPVFCLVKGHKHLLSTIICQSGLLYNFFADDSQLHKSSVPSDFPVLVCCLKDCIEDIE